MQPYPHGLAFRPITLQNAQYPLAVIIYVPKSYNAPHRVKDSGKFHIRRSNGNDEMTMDEIRNQFTFAAAFRERAKAFRKERVEAIAIPSHEDVPVILNATQHIILHIMPFSLEENSLDLINLHKQDFWEEDLSRSRFNIDGYVRFDVDGRIIMHTNICKYFATVSSNVWIEFSMEEKK
ncbi:hypothetical protein HC776_00375 [bacterium]|nr:hypothetical protein [bacterium]